MPVVFPRAQLIARCANFALLCEVIRDTRDKKRRIEKEVDHHAGSLQWTLDPEKWRQLETWCSTSAKRVYADTKARLISKFARLTLLPHQPPRVDKHRVVRNFSNRTLTEEEEDIMALGLNYGVTPKRSPH